MSAHTLSHRDETTEVVVKRAGGVVTATIAGLEHTVERLDAHSYLVSRNGKTRRVCVALGERKVFAEVAGRLVEFDIYDGADDGAGGHQHSSAEKDKVFAPMPGKIVKLLVSVGDEVALKQPLVIVESMKMENQVLSPSAGRVKAINCVSGDQVDTDKALVELEVG